MAHPIISRDKIWKATIEDLADDFIRYFYPDWSATEVDFNRPFEFLDHELNQLFPAVEGKNRRADKLIKIFLKSGEEKWVLVHVEVQDYPDPHFAKRMFTYFYRLQDKFHVNISALVIYTDRNQKHYPQKYEYQYLKTKLVYEFDVFEVMTKSEKELDFPDNPFSVLMLWIKSCIEDTVPNENQQFKRAIDLIKRLKEENPENSKKLQTLLVFLRYYFKFGKVQAEELNTEIIQIFKGRKPMGMQELLEIEYQKLYRAEGREEGVKEGVQYGKEQERLRLTIQNIHKFLQAKLLNTEQIAEFLEVELQFAEDVRDGKIYIDTKTDEVIFSQAN